MILEAFQESGAVFMASGYHRANGDEPGLGKTLQAIRAADLVDARSALVVCPASVRSSWADIIERMQQAGFARRCAFDVLSYNEAVKAVKSSVKSYHVVIPDECHFCKTVDSQRTRALFGSVARDKFEGFAHRSTFCWPMSGTFAPNGRPVELFPMLKSLHHLFADMPFAEYAKHYCGAYWDGREMNVKGASNVLELAQLLDGFLIRRTKREVFAGRKEPLVSRIGVELSNEDLRAVNEEEDRIGAREMRLSATYEQFAQLGDTSRLLRLLGLAMIPSVGQFVEDKLETVDKIVVFFKHTDVGAGVATYLGGEGRGCVVYEGGMSDAKKDAAIRRFTEDSSCTVFLGQVQAAGTGVNGLQRVASTVVFAEPDWTPGETEQRIDRLDRMGQEDDIVTAYLMYARRTLSATVVSVHDRKERTGAALLDPWRAALGDFA